MLCGQLTSHYLIFTLSYLKRRNEQNPFSIQFCLGRGHAAYQIEGAWNADGKGESIWDRFSHNARENHQTATRRRGLRPLPPWPEDIALMHQLGLKAYRFSVSCRVSCRPASDESTPPGWTFMTG